jgi:hypothetical protein
VTSELLTLNFTSVTGQNARGLEARTKSSVNLEERTTKSHANCTGLPCLSTTSYVSDNIKLLAVLGDNEGLLEKDIETDATEVLPSLVTIHEKLA